MAPFASSQSDKVTLYVTQVVITKYCILCSTGYDGHEFDEVPHYGYNFAHPPAHIDGHTYEPPADFHNEYSLGHYHHKLYNPVCFELILFVKKLL